MKWRNAYQTEIEVIFIKTDFPQLWKTQKLHDKGKQKADKQWGGRLKVHVKTFLHVIVLCFGL